MRWDWDVPTILEAMGHNPADVHATLSGGGDSPLLRDLLIAEVLMGAPLTIWPDSPEHPGFGEEILALLTYWAQELGLPEPPYEDKR